MKSEQAILMHKKALAGHSDSRLAGSLTLEGRAIAAYLDTVIARQNRLAARSTDPTEQE